MLDAFEFVVPASCEPARPFSVACMCACGACATPRRAGRFGSRSRADPGRGADPTRHQDLVQLDVLVAAVVEHIAQPRLGVGELARTGARARRAVRHGPRLGVGREEGSWQAGPTQAPAASKRAIFLAASGARRFAIGQSRRAAYQSARATPTRAPRTTTNTAERMSQARGFWCSCARSRGKPPVVEKDHPAHITTLPSYTSLQCLRHN